MKISDILIESTDIQYPSLYDEDGEMDYELMNSAEELVNTSGLNMLRDDEITDIAVHDGKVVGVMFSAVRGNEMNTSIAVDPQYRGRRIASELFDNLYIEGHVERHVAELVPPYTLESFLIRRGYKFVENTGDFKIYEKNLT